MINIECPPCAGDATSDEALTVLSCDVCGVAEIAPDPTVALDAAA